MLLYMLKFFNEVADLESAMALNRSLKYLTNS